MKMKICLIGCGEHAQIAHGPSHRKYAEQSKEVELAACCDLNAEKAAAFAHKFGYKNFYTDYHKMILIERPDAVAIVMPIHMTAHVLSEVINLGCPIIVEKPPAENLGQLKDLISLAGEHSAKIQVAFNRRYCPLVNVLTDEIRHFGRIQYLRYDMFRSLRTESNFHMTAIHGIDAVRHILKSDYHQVDIKYTDLSEYGPGVKNVFLSGTMKNGIAVHLNFCPVAGEVCERVTVNANDTTCYLDIPMWNVADHPGSLVILKNGKIEKTVSGLSLTEEMATYTCGGFYDENKHFLDALIKGENVYPALIDSLQTMEIAQAIADNKSQYVADN